MSSNREVSAGGVVLHEDQVLVIVPTRPAADGSHVLGLPKGHLDGEETLEQAAAREVREETGVTAELLGELGEVRYWYVRDRRRIAKSVHFFLFGYLSGDLADHDDEVLEARSHIRASATWWPARSPSPGKTDSLPVVQVLNFYSTIFADELKKGRKTATIRLGDKSGKYRKNQAVLVTIGYQYSPRERIFEAVIDQVEVMKVAELSPRDIKHDNPEFRRHEELINFLEQIDGRPVSMDDTVTVVRFSQILDKPTAMTEAMKGFGGAQN